MSNEEITHGGVFSGIGLFEYAAKKAGLKNVYSCEIEPFCKVILKQHYPNVLLFGDINSANPPRVDVMSGGFPCQDISYAKTHDTNGTFSVDGIAGVRSGLWWQYHRIIESTNPEFAVIENVKGLTKKGLDEVLQSLASIGYNAEWAVIPASLFGAPHERKRLWIVAYTDGYRREQESIVFGPLLSEKVRRAPEWELSRTICETNGKKALPSDYGIPDGHPRGLYDAKRMAAIGNGIVWVIAFEIFEIIKQLISNERAKRR